MAKSKYLTPKEVRATITKLGEVENKPIPIDILEQLEEKIFNRANKIAKTLNISKKTAINAYKYKKYKLKLLKP